MRVYVSTHNIVYFSNYLMIFERDDIMVLPTNINNSNSVLILSKMMRTLVYVRLNLHKHIIIHLHNNTTFPTSSILHTQTSNIMLFMVEAYKSHMKNKCFLYLHKSQWVGISSSSHFTLKMFVM
jgi:hypothetical protein